jgi:hypothetical protein
MHRSPFKYDLSDLLGVSWPQTVKPMIESDRIFNLKDVLAEING